MMPRLLFVFAFSASVVSAGNLGVPLSFDSAQVLPKGVRNFRYNYLMGEANDKFGPLGTVVGVGNTMNVDVTYQKFIDGQDTAVERGILQGYLDRHDKDMQSVAGRTTGEVNVEVDAQIPIFAWGITRKWTAALAVPFLRVRTHMDTGFVASGQFQAIADQLVSEGRGFKAHDIKKKTDQAISDKNDKYGYEALQPPSSFREESSLGDMRLVNKVQLSRKSDYTLTLSNELVFPTGRRKNINRAVDVPTGDGQFDVGMGAIAEYHPWKRVNLWARVNYLWQAPDEVAARVPEGGDSSLSPDLDGQIARDLGDSVYAGVGGSLDLYGGVKMKAQYSYQYKERDRYAGSGDIEADRYRFLGQGTEQSLHAVQLGINYSTVSLFQRKKFPIPLDFNVISGIPVSGRNVTKDTTLLAEAALFF